MRIRVFAYLVAQSILTLVLYISNSSSYRLVHPWFLGTLFNFAMSNQNDFLVLVLLILPHKRERTCGL